MNKSNSSEEKELPLYKETEVRVPIHLKITLTIREAAEYSNIGINKIDSNSQTALLFYMLEHES